MNLDVAAIRRVWDDYASHINCAGPNCCKGCTLARQIPTLLDEVDRLRDANENLIRNAEILADELVLGTEVKWS